MTAMSMQPVLSTIAQRFYGAGGAPIQGQRWAGTALTRYGVIYPGWVLRLPEATRANAKRARSSARGGVEKTTTVGKRRFGRTFTGTASIAESEDTWSMNWFEAWSITKLAELQPRLEAALHHRQRGDIVTQQAISIGVAVVVVGAILVAFYKIVGTALDNFGTQLSNVGH
jgi:hypothetical protein